MIKYFMSDLVIGLVVVGLGIWTWKKQNLVILHEYHYKNVKPEDIPAYTKAMGIGEIVIGAGLCLTAVCMLFSSNEVLVYAPVAASVVIGVLVMNKAQMKYNGGWCVK